MEVKTFKGSPTEIGIQLGEAYRDLGLTLGWVKKINDDLLKEQIKIYTKYYPEMIEEVLGIARGAHFDEENTLLHFLTCDIYWHQRQFVTPNSCTIFGVKNSNGAFVGRNYDWHPSSENMWELYMVKQRGRYPVLATTDMATAPISNPEKTFYYASDAINNYGFYIGMTYASSNEWSFGVSVFHIARFIAERCKTVEEAIKLFDIVPVCTPKNFFMADKNGDMAVIEHTSQEHRVIKPSNGILIHTNHFLNSELAEDEKVDAKSTTHTRYNRALKSIEPLKDKFAFHNILEVLSNDEVYENSKDSKTLWSLALDLKSGKKVLFWNLTGEAKHIRLVI